MMASPPLAASAGGAVMPANPRATLPALQRSAGAPYRPGFDTAVRRQLHVFNALILHDVKARFFGNGLGYILMILWPTSHIAVVVAIYYFTSREAPYGSDRLLYAAIGVLPFIIWNYISRFTLLAVVQNRSFLQYPPVKPLDIMIARQGLELVSSTIITVALVLFLVLCQSDVWPHRIDQAAFALLSAVLLGIGFGIFNGVICMLFPFWNVCYVLILIVFWATSGVAINPEAMPTAIGELLAWNPLLHCIEWLRLAYYDDFPAHLLNKSYVIYVGAGSLACGLVMERLLRFFLLL